LSSPAELLPIYISPGTGLAQNLSFSKVKKGSSEKTGNFVSFISKSLQSK